jgi:hypothetical protein
MSEAMTKMLGALERMPRPYETEAQWLERIGESSPRSYLDSLDPFAAFRVPRSDGDA